MIHDVLTLVWKGRNLLFLIKGTRFIGEIHVLATHFGIQNPCCKPNNGPSRMLAEMVGIKHALK